MSGWQPQDYDPRWQQPPYQQQYPVQPNVQPNVQQPYAPGYGQPYGYPPQQFTPPPRRSFIRRHPVLTTLAALFAFFVFIGVGASLHGTSSQNGTGASGFGSATQGAAPATSAAAAVKQSVTFVVTGSAADVTYGPSGTSVQGTVPMRVTKPLGNPVFYSLYAQLQGGGEVTCKILVDGKVISESVASGGYNIADCEISQDIITGQWSDTNAA